MTTSTCPLCRVGQPPDWLDLSDGDTTIGQLFKHVTVDTPLVQVSPGHLLIVPRRHYAYVWDYPEWIIMHVMFLQRRVARWLIDHGAHGVNVLHASGEAAGQSVFHAHWHVVPRYRNDGLDLWLRDRHLHESLTREVSAGTFYERDEPVADVRRAWDDGEPFTTERLNQ